MARTSVFALSAFALLALARPQDSLDSVLMSVVAEADGVPVPTSWETIQPTPSADSDSVNDGGPGTGSIWSDLGFDDVDDQDPNDLSMCGGDGPHGDPNYQDVNPDYYSVPDSTDMDLSYDLPIPTNSGIVPPWLLSSGVPDMSMSISMPADAIITSAPAYTPPPKMSTSTRSSSSSSSSSASRPTSVPTGGAATNQIANAGLVLAGLGLVVAL